MSSSYSLSKTLPSCKVDQTLLKELEKYIQQKVKDIVPVKEKGTIKYALRIKESIGSEKFNSIEEYDRTYFPNDIESITIDCENSFSSDNISVKLRLATYKMVTNLDINFTGTSARETVMSLSDEILRRVEPFKSNNYLFNLYDIYGGIVISILISSGAILSNSPLFNDTYKTQIQIITISLIICVIGWFILFFIKPYCTFKTTLNERREAAVKWIFLGIVGFILFTVFGVYLRQKVFGF